MAEVLPPQLHPEHGSQFGALRRSSSHTNLLLQSTPTYSASSSDFKSKFPHSDYEARHSISLPSSAPSSPRLAQPDFSNQPSYLSTPSSSLSLDEQCSSDNDDISFPSYDDEDTGDARGRALGRAQQRQTPATPSKLTILEAPLNTPTSNPLLKAPSQSKLLDNSTAGDDTAVLREPSRHVDYLSHNWKEEDIWSSWKFVVSRRNAYSNSPRLENAAWRTWTKTMYRLKTISPEQLNWMKDHDVTWLYGPLQTGNSRLLYSRSSPPTSQISRSNSFGSKKPILKKRSLSELMLQRSRSSSTLMKQATDALRAQQPGERLRERPILRTRVESDFTSTSSSTTPSADSAVSSSSVQPSAMTSGRQSPCTRKHIHFNNKVEQCIAINKDRSDHGDYFCAVHDESSSDDDMLTMKPVERPMSNPSTPRNSFSSENKTIAMLPSTTLNYRGDTPDPVKQQAKQRDSFWSQPSRLNHSSSQETIKTSSTSANFLLDDDDDELDTNWQPCAGRRASVYPVSKAYSPTYDSEEDARSGLRRTPSGMFMPYEEEDEDEIDDAGLFGKVVDTVNTAKDIAHVIWNVGWRR